MDATHSIRYLERNQLASAMHRQPIFMRDASLPPDCGTPVLLVARHLRSIVLISDSPIANL
jgi:hypothetical protein